jgi:hypothetical protein
VTNITENVKYYPETVTIPETANIIQCMGSIPGKGSFLERKIKSIQYRHLLN